MIQVNGLTKRYGSFTAVNNITFEVAQGEIVGFLGPNGAGKTTTMRVLTGYIPPTEGAISIAGCDIFSDSIKARQHIGYMPESVPLYEEMTVRGYLLFMAEIRAVRKRRQAVDEVMGLCHVQDYADVLVGALSKGYRQRVGLAQALVHKADVLILDEPTIGLDPRQIIDVRELIRQLGKERTVLLSSHILPEVSQVCTRVLIIHKGRIVAEDTPDRLKTNLQGAARLVVEVARPSAAVKAALAAVPDVQTVEAVADSGRYEITCALGADARSAIADAVVKGGWGLLGLRSVEMSLEDIFLSVTREDPLAEGPTSEPTDPEVEPNA
jgi:ABC-2 type transport system ATP-binding protein